MHVFVTGASGWIGSASVTELLNAGHEVTGLARSAAAAATIEALGATVLRGDLDDLDSLRAGASAADSVVHLGYIHDFTRIPDAARTDRAAIDAIGDVLAGTNAAFVIASGVSGSAPGRVVTEEDIPDQGAHPRIANAWATLELATRGVRSVVVRFAPTVHGPGDHGFIATLVGIAREKGVSGYIGDGSNHWPAVHRLDAGALVRLAVEDAPAATILHATAEEGVPTRAIAEAIGGGLGLATQSIPAQSAAEHFDWLGQFFVQDIRASSAATRELMGWKPTHPTLLEDLEAGYYYT